MSIPVTCPECGAINKVNDSLAGRRVRCPECDTAVHVPEIEVAAGAPALPPELPPELPSSVDTQSADTAASESLAESEAAEATSESASSVKVVSGMAAMQPSPSELAAELAEDDDDEPVMKRAKRDEEELDMTPMVDVTFLLLIFFMVTAAFSLQKSIQMPRQQTDAPSTTVVEEDKEEMETVEIQIDEFGSFLVISQDADQETPGKQNLIAILKDVRGKSDAMRLAIKVHEQCKLQYLVDAMDAGTIANFTETQVTQVEEF